MKRKYSRSRNCTHKGNTRTVDNGKLWSEGSDKGLREGTHWWEVQEDTSKCSGYSVNGGREFQAQTCWLCNWLNSEFCRQGKFLIWNLYQCGKYSQERRLSGMYWQCSLMWGLMVLAFPWVDKIPNTSAASKDVQYDLVSISFNIFCFSWTLCQLFYLYLMWLTYV